jgi:hypothetical protein
MDSIEHPLWVITFSPPTSEKGPPSVTYSEPKQEIHVPLQLSDKAALQFFEQMQGFFRQILDTSQDSKEEEVKLEDLTKSLEDLQEWMKKFQKFLNNPDDLTGKDPPQDLK